MADPIVKEATATPAWLADLERLARKAPRRTKKAIASRLHMLRAMETAASGVERTEAKCKAEQAERRAGEMLGEARAAFEPALSKLVEALDLATAIEEDKQDYLPPETLARCIRLIVWEAGEELEQALCDLGLVPEDDCSRFVDDLKSRIPYEAQPRFMEMYTRWSKAEQAQEAGDPALERRPVTH